MSILVNVEKLMKLPMEAEGVMSSRAQVAAMIRSPTEMERHCAIVVAVAAVVGAKAQAIVVLAAIMYVESEVAIGDEVEDPNTA